ncbi:MAG TPA: class I SAM-dependent methyltransferase [Segetibacter sp.]
MYKDTFDSFLELVPLNANILELGGGPGNVVKYLKSKRNDLNILGIDLAPEMIKEAERQNPDSTFELMDIRDADQIKQKFDAVIAAFCIPYISYSDAADLFRKFKNLIKGNGILYISCMEGTRERSGFEKTSFTGDNKMYINYYERSEIELWLKEQNFNIEAFYTKDYPETDGSTTTDIFCVAKKV